MNLAQKFHVSPEQMLALGKQCLIVAASAVLTYLAQWITTVDFGQNSAAIVGVLTIIINWLLHWLSDEQGKIGGIKVV